MATMDFDDPLFQPGCSTQIFGSSSSKHFCLKCATKFPSLTSLYKHKVQCTILRKTSFSCQSCKRSFFCRSLYLKHSCSKSHQRRYRNLQLKHSIPSDLTKIPKKKKVSQKPRSPILSTSGIGASCLKCNKKFSSTIAYKDHLKSGACVKYSCNTCHQKFVYKRDLQVHHRFCSRKHGRLTESDDEEEKIIVKKKKRNAQSRVFQCKACEKTYPLPQLLKKHLELYPYCARQHNLKIKLRCMWERGVDFNRSARKSMSNYNRSEKTSISTLRNLPTLEWDSEPSTSKDILIKPGMKSARKSFGHSRVSETSSYCELCYRYLDTYEIFEHHQEKHHGIEIEVEHEPGRCPHCLKLFSDKMSLVMHQNVEDHWAKAIKSMTTSCTCPFCDKEFLLVQSRNVHLRSHIETHPEEVKEFLHETTCSKCSQIFSNDHAKAQHMRIKHGRYEGGIPSKVAKYSTKGVHKITPTIMMQLKNNPNECPICKRVYSTSFIRNRHFRSHTLEQVYECPYCANKFTRAERLTHHMQEYHQESLGYECKDCSMRFLSRMGVLQHVNKSHPGKPANSLIKERNVFANSQHKTYTMYASTLTPTQHKGMPSQEFYCDVCELKFLKLCGLQRHRQSKLHRQMMDKSEKNRGPSEDPEDRPPLSLTPPFIDYSRQFVCSSCSEEFENVSDFVTHRLSHFNLQEGAQTIDELNTYSCEICQKVMDNIQKIQLHLFWHMQDVQLQSGLPKSSGSPRTSYFENDRPVAKKSMGKPTWNLPQELLVGGVKKYLYTCKSCKIGFTTRDHYSIHIKNYCKSGAKEGKPKAVTAGFCKICGCIFSGSELYEEHKTSFCNKNTFVPLKDNAESIYTEMVKSLVKLNTMVAGCVRCNLAFNSLKSLSQHAESMHTVKQNGDGINDPKENGEKDSKDTDDEVPDDHIHILDIDMNNVNYCEKEKEVKLVKISVEKDGKANLVANEDSEDTITTLRENFSKLLNVLVSDSELMTQLGYGKELIDSVLTSVMKKMKLKVVPEDDTCTELERLRKNIHTFMDVCIKDQVMELISDNDDNNIDRTVIGALHIFGVDDDDTADDDKIDIDDPIPLLA